MMKTENVFKFVAIRAPQADKGSSRKNLSFERRDWVERIRGLARGNVSLDEARRRLSSEFIDSSAYVLRSPDWQPFLRLQTEIQELLETADNGDDFKSSLEPLLAAVDAGFAPLEHFVGSEAFQQLKTSLWHSYYSNIALVDHRPQDRPLLDFWLRFWHFLERLQAGDDFEVLRHDFERWTLTVPHLLVQSAKTSTAAETSAAVTVSAAAAEHALQVREINDSIAHLQAARSQVNQVFHAKLLETAKKAAQEGAMELKPLKDAGGANLGISAPWMLTAKEVGNETAKTLENLGIALERHDATEITALLESRQAEWESRLFALEHRERISIVRGVPVRVRRKESGHDETRS